MRFRFDAFVFDDGTRQLLRDGRERHLGPKAFDLLGLLLSQRPNVLTKGRIRDRLWPATAVVDSTVATVVAELRAALGEDPDSPAFSEPFTASATPSAGRRGKGTPGRRRQAPTPDTDSSSTTARSRCTRGRTCWGGSKRVSFGSTPTVSRRHARIVVNRGQAVLEDLGSKNGTFLRNRRVSTPVPLSHGDKLRLGRVTMTFRALSADETTRTDGLD